MAFGGSRAPSLLEELEQEMKLLHWHKLANEAALKAALIRSKRLKARDNKVILQEAKQQERAVWIQKVLEEEQQKPLEVTDDFIRGYETREQKNQEKLAQEVRVAGYFRWLPLLITPMFDCFPFYFLSF